MPFLPWVATIGNLTPPLPVVDGGTGAATVAAAQTALSVVPLQSVPWLPADSGLLAATSTLDSSATTFIPTAGTVYLTKLVVRAPFAITNIVYIVRSAGVGASTGSFVGVYNPSGTLLSGTADIGANLITAGDYSTALTTPQTANTIGALAFVWVALVTNLATTQPTMNAWANATFTIPNLNLTAATARCATNGTGQTTLPASITPASNVLGGSTLWFGVS